MCKCWPKGRQALGRRTCRRRSLIDLTCPSILEAATSTLFVLFSQGGAAAFMAMREYEKRENPGGDHQLEKEVIAGIAGAEVCSTKAYNRHRGIKEVLPE